MKTLSFPSPPASTIATRRELNSKSARNVEISTPDAAKGAALRDFNSSYVGVGVKLGHSAMLAQCPVCPKTDTTGRFYEYTLLSAPRAYVAAARSETVQSLG